MSDIMLTPWRTLTHSRPRELAAYLDMVRFSNRVSIALRRPGREQAYCGETQNVCIAIRAIG
jgi:hypothetical protein